MASSDLVGKKLGDYTLERKFASGGMAHIYLGRDEKLGRLAAVKVLTPEILAQDSTLAERFAREARAVAQLEHDNIIPIYQFDLQDDLYFLAMRYVDGNDLSQEINNYKKKGTLMPVDRALYILAQVASALDHAHEHGIIHRDVKPSNVLLGAYDKAFLSDFGLVLWQGVDRTMGTAFGTPRYIAPEQATDSEQSVPESDIYSLAVVVYEILTGQNLFKGNTPMEVALAHITEQPTPPRSYNANIPANAQQEILRALQKDPTKRHGKALEFINAVQAAYDNIEPGTQPLTPVKLPEVKPDADGGVPPTRLFPIDEDLFDGSMGNPAGQSQSKSIRDQWPDAILSDDTDANTLLESDKLGSSPVIRKVPPSQPSIPNRPTASSNMPLILAILAVMVAIVAVLIVLVRETGNTNNGNAESPTLVASVLTTTAEAAIANVATEVLAISDADATNTPDNAPTDIPTDVPTETPTLTPTLTPTEGPTMTPMPASMVMNTSLQFNYNQNIFTIQNISENTISIDSLSFTAVRDADGDMFDSNTQNLGVFLQPNTCIALLSGTARASDIPTSWNCNLQRDVRLSSQTVFWFADSSDDQAFTIRQNDVTLATCDTVGRAVARLLEMTCP